MGKRGGGSSGKRGEHEVRARHDGFTAEKQRRFLRTLAKTGCLSDAARAAAISRNTAGRWRLKDARFARLCEAAIDRASSHIETLAWERAVTGIEEPIIHQGKHVGTRIRRSDAIFRMLLMASNRRKYGRMGDLRRKEIEKELRARIEAELRAKWTKATREETDAAIMKKLEGLRRNYLRQGWTENPDGQMIPPGYGPVSAEAKAAAAEAEGMRGSEEPRREPEA